MRTKIAAIGDVHIGRSSFDTYTELFTQIGKVADILLLCGDLTHNGSPEEAKKLIEQLTECPIPKLTVLGNHDYHQNKEAEIKHILHEGEVICLEDEPFIFRDIGFTGVKGFGGGFGTHTLGMFGEEEMKGFARTAIAEAEMLEVHLDDLEHDNMQKKIVMMHYSPITDTLKGEPLEIYPFLGTSRLEEVIDRFTVTAVFHAHAHFGSPEGKTAKGVPVYNVALPVLKKISKEAAYKIVEV